MSDEEVLAFAKWGKQVQPVFPKRWCVVKRNVLPDKEPPIPKFDLLIQLQDEEVWQRVTPVALDVLEYPQALYVYAAYANSEASAVAKLEEAPMYLVVKCLRASDPETVAEALADFKDSDKRTTKKWSQAKFNMLYLTEATFSLSPDLGEVIATAEFSPYTSTNLSLFEQLEPMLLRSLCKEDHQARYFNRITGPESELREDFLKLQSGYQIQYLTDDNAAELGIRGVADLQSIGNVSIVHVAPGFEKTKLRVLDDIPSELSTGLSADESAFWGVKGNPGYLLSSRASVVDDKVFERVSEFVRATQAEFVSDTCGSIDEDNEEQATSDWPLGKQIRRYHKDMHVSSKNPKSLFRFNSPSPALMEIDSRVDIPVRRFAPAQLFDNSGSGSSSSSSSSSSAVPVPPQTAPRPRRGQRKL
jgi:hypothetical protein